MIDLTALFMFHTLPPLYILVRIIIPQDGLLMSANRTALRHYPEVNLLPSLPGDDTHHTMRSSQSTFGLSAIT